MELFDQGHTVTNTMESIIKMPGIPACGISLYFLLP